jgi:WD40 repeat protein
MIYHVAQHESKSCPSHNIWTLTSVTTPIPSTTFVTSVVFSHDSNLQVSASEDGTVRVWKPGSGVCVSTLEGRSSWVTSVTLSYNSTLQPSASRNGTVKVWNTGNGECLHRDSIERALYCVSFDFSDNFLVTGIGITNVSA